MTDSPDPFEQALATATGARDALTAMRATCTAFDAEAAKLRADRDVLMKDRRTDPLKLGREVGALDHALTIVSDRKAAVAAEIAEELALYLPKLRRLAWHTSQRAEGRLEAIARVRREKVLDLARENKCAWAFGVPTVGEPGFQERNLVTTFLMNLSQDPRLAELQALRHDGKLREDQAFPAMANERSFFAMADRLTRALKETESLLPAEPAEQEPAAVAA